MNLKGGKGREGKGYLFLMLLPGSYREKEIRSHSHCAAFFAYPCSFCLGKETAVKNDPMQHGLSIVDQIEKSNASQYIQK